MARNPVHGTDSDDLNLFGSNGDDAIRGYAGNDLIQALAGDDLVRGGGGDDTIYVGAGQDLAYGGDGNDRLFAGGNGVNDYDRLYGDAGSDIFTFYNGNNGEAYGGTGFDTVQLYLGGNDAIALDFSQPVSTLTQGSATLTFDGIEKLFIVGSSAGDHIIGGSHDDYINVVDGDNLADGGAGNDRIDYQVGGVNHLDGGRGHDTLGVAALDDVALQFRGSTTQADDGYGSVLVGFEDFFVGGSSLADRIAGAGGNDVLSGHRGNDRISGGGGNDALGGDEGDDRLFGGSGSDLLSGGRGHDIMTGGSGADHFVYTDADEFGDRIRDFVSGEDDFWITELATGNHLHRGEVPLVSNEAAFGGAAQFVVIHAGDGSTTALYWDADGTGADAARLIATLDGNIALDAGDFDIRA